MGIKGVYLFLQRVILKFVVWLLKVRLQTTRQTIFVALRTQLAAMSVPGTAWQSPLLGSERWQPWLAPAL